ncbi:MAG: TMEM165/GDT1 family protein [Nanoarchaeota archaeon]|nr:TMEM165/GDT1 family protein [Nanoarchaeota archaeon]
MPFNDVLVSSVTVALSELGDKSHIITLLLASKYKDHIRVFIGIMLAFFIAILMAILFGSILSNLLLSKWARIVIAFTMVVFGIYTYLSHEKGPIKISKHSPLVSSFIMILFAEMGDKSQFVSGFFATKQNIVLLTIGLLIGLGVITYATIYIGRKFNKHIHPKIVHYVAGSIFIMIGVLTFIGVY